MINNKTLIMISTPTLGNIRIETAQRIASLVREYDDYKVVWPHSPIIQPLDAARNRAVKKFIEISNHPDDRLLFIDDDIVSPVNTITQLADHNKDIVGACCFVMKADKGQYFPMPVSLRYNKDKKFIVHYDTGLARIDATGGGCIMIKRKVFETMDRPYQYDYYPNGELALVADYAFCQRAAENGFKLWYDWGCICDHIKPVSIKGINDLLVGVTANG